MPEEEQSALQRENRVINDNIKKLWNVSKKLLEAHNRQSQREAEERRREKKMSEEITEMKTVQKKLADTTEAAATVNAEVSTMVRRTVEGDVQVREKN